MKFILLARDDQSPTTQILLRLDADLDVWPVSLSVEQLAQRLTNLRTKSKQSLNPQGPLVIPRLGILSRQQGLLALKEIERLGLQTLYSSEGLLTLMDKHQMLAKLTQAQIPTPLSFFFTQEFALNEDDLHKQKPGRFWIKTRFGSQGLGVSWADSAHHALAQMNLIRVSGGDGLVQSHEEGIEYRSLLVNGKILASMIKCAQGPNPRKNAYQGASLQRAELTEVQNQTLQDWGSRLNAPLLGIDWILSSSGGMTCLEVNPSPGWAALQGSGFPDLSKTVLQELLNWTLEQTCRR